MGRPRIVIFTPVYPPMKGGSATYFSTLAGLLSDRYDITVVCLKGPGGARDGAVKVMRVLPDRRSSSRLVRYASVLPATFSILRRSKREGPFVLHAHSNGIYGYSAALFSSLFSVPLIKEVQDTSDSPHVLRSGNVHRWIATSDFVRERLIDAGIQKERVRTFPSINPPRTRELASGLVGIDRPRGTRIVFVGWLMDRVKGVDNLVRAFGNVMKDLDDPGLVIVGDGPDRGYLEGLAEGMPVEFRGELDYPETLREIAMSHFLVLPSHEEANPRVVIEAFAVGTPVIATDVGGVKEEVRDGVTGLLVPDNDPVALEEAIVRLGKDPELRAELARGGREFVEGLPDWDAIAGSIASDYDEAWRIATGR